MNAMFYTVTYVDKNEIDISFDAILPTAYLFKPNFIFI